MTADDDFKAAREFLLQLAEKPFIAIVISDEVSVYTREITIDQIDQIRDFLEGLR